MPTIAEIRERFPSARDLTDGQIIERLSSLTQTPYEEVAGRFGFYQDTPRGVLGATNDYMIEAANSAAGLVSSVGNMVSPGNRFSSFIEDEFIKPGQAKQSVPVQLAKRQLGRSLNTDDIGTQAKGVWDYVTENPMLAASQAAGSFGPLGTGIKAAQFGTTALATRAGLGAAKAAAAGSRAGLGTGAVLSGAAAGGDAGGSAYDLVKETPWEVLSQHPQAQALLAEGLGEAEVYEELATRAARRASVVPAIIGAVAGATGAEKALTGGVRGLAGAGKTVLKEFGGEALEEGTTQYSGQAAASEYNPEINPMTGVVGAGLLGGALGAGTAAPIALANMRQEPTADTPNADLLKRGLPVDDAPLAPPVAPAPATTQPLGNVPDLTKWPDAAVQALVDFQMAKETPNQVLLQAAMDEMDYRRETGKTVADETPVDTALPTVAPGATPDLTAAPATPAAPTVTADGTPIGLNDVPTPAPAPTAPAGPAPQQIQAVSDTLGITPAQGVNEAWDVLGGRIYGQGQLNTLLTELSTAVAQLPPQMQELTRALVQAGAVRLPAGSVPSAKKVQNAVNSAVKRLQLEGVSDLPRMGEIINDQISGLIQQGKTEGDPKLGQLAMTYENLFGAPAPATAELDSGTTTVGDAFGATANVPQTSQAKQTKAKGPAATAVQPATAGQPAAGATGTPVEAPGVIAGIDPTKTTEIGRAGRKVTVNPQQLLQKIAAATPLEKARIMNAAGLEVVEDPTTGAPRIIQSSEPKSFAEVAEAESAFTGVSITPDAIRQSLAKFGITPEVLDRVAGTGMDTVTTDELGIADTEGADTGFRVGESLSRIAGEGLVQGTETKKQKETREAADDLMESAVRITSRKQEDGTTIYTIDKVEDGTPALQGEFPSEEEARRVAKKGLPGQRVAKVVFDGGNKAKAAVPAVAPAPDPNAKVTDLRQGNKARVDANIRAALESPDAEAAAAEWNAGMTDRVIAAEEQGEAIDNVTFDQLPDTLKVDWILGYMLNKQENDGEPDFQALERLQEELLDDYRKIQAKPRADRQGIAGPEGRKADKPADGKAAGRGKGSLGQDQQVEDATEIIRTPEEQYTTLAAQAKQLVGVDVTAYGELSEAKRNRVDDMARRGVLDLAALNRIVAAKEPKSAADMEREGQLVQAGQAWKQYAPEGVTWDSLTAAQKDQWREVNVGGKPSMAAAERIANPEAAPRIVRNGQVLENIDRLSTTQSGTAQAVRSPSVKREVEKLLKRLDEGDLTPEAFAARVDLVLKSYDTARDSKPRQPRQRGADYIRQRLLEAKRRGDLSEQAVDFAEWFILKNPALVEDLAVSIRSKDGAGSSGNYEPFRRLMTLMKESSNDETTVHEIMHHLERMMPPAMQAEIRKLWLKSMASASKGVDATSTLGKFFEALRKHHFEGNSAAMREAMEMLKDGDVEYSFYQYVNPSEFWAVNSTRIMQGRFGVKDSTVGQIKQWLKELAQKIKAVFGLPSDAPIIKALDSLVKGDGKFVSTRMLMEGVGYDMFAGKQALSSDQYAPWEKQMARYASARLMASNGATAAEIWRKTGWERNPDGKWRFEISDKQAKFKQDFAGLTESKLFSKTPYKLGEVLDHPELFAAYPELADVVFVKDKPFMDFFGETQGWFSEDKNEIAVTPYAEDPLSTLLHEVQHWVQMKEKFAPGGNPEATKLSNTAVLNKLKGFLDSAAAEGGQQTERSRKLSGAVDQLLARQDEIKALETRVTDAQAAVAQAEAEQIKVGNDILAEVAEAAKKQDDERKAQMAIWDQLRDERAKYRYGTPEYTRLKAEADEQWKRVQSIPYNFESAFGPKYQARRDAAKAKVTAAKRVLEAAETAEKDYLKAVPNVGDIKYSMYKLISGEAEARNTQRRQNLSAKERRRVAPEVTADVPYDTQVVTDRRTGKAASLANIERRIKQLPEPAQEPVQTITDMLRAAGKNTLAFAAFTEDLARIAKDVLPSATKYVKLMGERVSIKTRYERTVDSVLERFDKLPQHLRGDGPGTVNAFLRESTMDGKWGFVPDWLPNFDPVKDIDAGMERKFNALPKAAQEVVVDVFRHGNTVLKDMKNVVVKNMTSEFDVLIEAAAASGDQKEFQKLTKEKADTLTNYRSLMSLREDTPYAPLKRFGDYVVVSRSADYVQATKDGDQKRMRELERNPAHYEVSFYETEMQAKAAAREMAAKPAFANGLVQDFQKDLAFEQMHGGKDMLNAFFRLRGLVNSGTPEVGEAGTKALNRMVADLYFTILGETSARNAERNRRNIAGADKDMMRAFATQGRATANFISNLHNSSKIHDALDAMKKEADDLTPGRADRRRYYNEFVKRHAMGIDYEANPLIEKALSGTSMWMLLTNPAYYLQNATQPMMISMPVVAGKHGYTRTWGAFAKAYKDVAGLIRKHGVGEELYNKLPADVSEAVKQLVDRGRINISLDQDIGNWRSTEDSKLAIFSKVSQKFRGVAQDLEAINRVVTAVAAYRLERSGPNPGNALEYADRIIYDTHGDYSGFNAPRIARTGIGRLATQFRKFQLIMLSLNIKLLKDAFAGATPQERAVARASATFLYSHLFVMGGAVALPGFSAISMLLGAVFGDDDEPNNPELALRRAIGDDDLADFLLRGTPKLAGVDLSGKLGMGTMLSVLPYTDPEMSREGYAEMVTALLGPFLGGVMPRAVEGAAMIGGGDYYKGLEMLLPSGFSNLARGVRFASEGVTQRNGDVNISADDINFAQGFMVALGLPTNTITDRRFLQDAKFKMDEFYTAKTTELKQAYSKAFRDNDVDAMAKVREEWMEIQTARRENGFKVQPLSTLLKAPQEQLKRERNTAGGVQFTPTNRRFVTETE